MRHPRIALGLTMTAALLWPVTGSVTAGSAATYTPLPARVYAPYYGDLSRPEYREHLRHRLAVRRQVLHAGVPPDPQEGLVRPGLEQQLVPAAGLLRGAVGRPIRATTAEWPVLRAWMPARA
jgi:hypothetical protein